MTNRKCERAQGQIVRGERYTLLQNNGTKWDVKDGAGRKMTAPAVCFMIPPTDPKAVTIADRWVCTQSCMRTTIQTQCWIVITLCTCSLASQQSGIKQKMGSSKKVLVKRFDELKKSGTGTGTLAPKSLGTQPFGIRQKFFFFKWH